MSDSPVTEEDVRHVARLARIDIDAESTDRFVEQFGEILAAFDALDSVPEVDIEVDFENVLRPDHERPGLEQTEALENAPETEDGYFKGPSVS